MDIWNTDMMKSAVEIHLCFSSHSAQKTVLLSATQTLKSEQGSHPLACGCSKIGTVLHLPPGKNMSLVPHLTQTATGGLQQDFAPFQLSPKELCSGMILALWNKLFSFGFLIKQSVLYH